MELDEALKLALVIATLFSIACTGVWWLVSIAIAKGDAQAKALSTKLDDLCGGISETIHTFNAASIERHELYQKHIDTRIDNIDDKADRALQSVSHLENQFNYFQGQQRGARTE